MLPCRALKVSFDAIRIEMRNRKFFQAIVQSVLLYFVGHVKELCQYKVLVLSSGCGVNFIFDHSRLVIQLPAAVFSVEH